MAANNYSTNELMAVTASRLLKDGQNIVVGLGLPQMAALLARSTHAPNTNIIYEIGVVNAEAVDPGVGLADPRLWYRSEHFTGFVGTLGQILQKGLVDVGFLGALQIDQYGNLNSTQVDEVGGLKHFTGSGGAADIATYAKNIFVIAKHEKRKIVATLDFVTTAGCLKGYETRKEAGLPACDSLMVITNLCVFGLQSKTNRLEVKSLHPGVTAETIIANTGFAVDIPAGTPITAEPEEKELTILRTQIDPRRMYIK